MGCSPSTLATVSIQGSSNPSDANDASYDCQVERWRRLAIEVDPVRRANPKSGYAHSKTMLGDGSYGSVRSGVHKKSRHGVAMKTIRPYSDRCQAEADILHVLTSRWECGCATRCSPYCKNRGCMDRCPAVLFYDAFVHRDLFHLAMELGEGDLFSTLYEYEEMDAEQCRPVVRSVAAGIAYCHSQGIAHLDIKPENVVWANSRHGPFCPGLPRCLGRDGCQRQLKLADFGLAAAFVSGETHSRRVGAAEYVAPEVLRGSYLPPAADVWSLGIILFLMLCGETPFEAPLPEVTMQRVLHAEVTYPPLVGAESREFLSGLLNRDAGARLTIEGCLAHAWLGTDGEASGVDGVDVVPLVTPSG